uniref:AKNA domain-containing protein n=1 Tax=Callorhinchus milii TaxID=7868 RepID=A0A4W3HYG1_CALMI
MEYSEADTNLKALNELNTDDSEDSLEKLDDDQFIRFLENNCKGLQKSHEDLDNEWSQQGQEDSLLWEESFEHSILLEVDDDFNLNFTEVHDSYTICVSQSSAEDPNITTDDISNIESEYSFDDEKVSSIDEHQFNYSQHIQSPSNLDKYSEPKGSLMQNLESNFSGNKVQDVPDNTTDEEQEELPYDGNLQITKEHQTDTIYDLDNPRVPLTILVKSRQNDGPDCGMAGILAKKEQSNVETALYQKEMTCTRVSPETEDSGKYKIEATNLTSEDNGNTMVSEHEMKLEHNKRDGRRSNIAESLLRHFSEEDLALSSTKYIDTETLPETSFTETIEETVIKKQTLSAASNNSPTSIEKCTALQAAFSKKEKVNEFANEKKVSRDYSYCDRSAQSQAANLLQTSNNNCRENLHHEMQEKNENLQFNPKMASGFFENFKMGKIISYNEIKYGKGKPHYPLPDFSKVAPKIKIPKRNSYNKYTPSRIKKAKSSPHLSYTLTSHTSTVDVVQEVLDSIQPPAISTSTTFNKQEFVKDNHSPELFQQLQEEFDKLLIKYAEAENTIDQLRFGAKVSIFTDSTKPNQIIQSGISPSPSQITTLAKQVCNNSPTPLSINYGVTTSASRSPNTEMNETTEAEQMAQKLNKHVDFFKHQVKEFEEKLNSNTISVGDQQKVFKQMRDDQDKLERRYITAKEEHRSLEQRHYIEKNTAVGEFDPDRKIEGEIFKLGMHLECIKEKIDDNVCNQPSPHNSFLTSTPLPPTEILSAGCAIYSKSPMAAINQEGVMLTFETSSVSAEIPDSIELKMIPEMDSQPSLLEDSYDHIPQQVPHIEHSKTVSTLTEGYFHSSEFFPVLSMNQTLPLPSTSSQAQDVLTERKQQILSPDSGFVGSESSRPPTSKQILDSEQPETERSPRVCEGTPSIERQKSSSSHRSETMIVLGEDKASCLLHLANASSCSIPFNWSESVIGITDIPAQQGEFHKNDAKRGSLHICRVRFLGFLPANLD